MVAPPGALRWATRRASFVIPGCFGAVAFEFLRVVAFAARDTDLFFNGLLVMVFSSGIAAQIGAATGATGVAGRRRALSEQIGLSHLSRSLSV